MTKAKPKAASFERGTLDAVIALMVRGHRPERIAASLTAAGELTARTAPRYITEARRLVTLSAAYDRDEELGRAVRRLNEVYGAAVMAKELKVQLDATKEINRLLGLYHNEPTAAVDTESAGEQAARAYLEPLELAPPGTPLAELARIAVDRLLPHLGD